MKVSYPQRNYFNAYDVLEHIFNSPYNGIAIVNLDGDWLKINDSICHILGYSKSELFNMDISNIIFIEDLGA